MKIDWAVFSIMFFAFSYITVCGVFLIAYGEDTGEEIVPCYDKYGNIIQGQTCISEGYDYLINDPVVAIILFFIIEMILVLFCILLNMEHGEYY